jgi:hypothetical protein
VKKRLNPTNKNRVRQPFEWVYNKDLQVKVLSILDINDMYPLYLKDPDAGMYKIIRTSNGKLQMSK